MGGEQTKRMIALQPEWLRALAVEERLPAGARVLYTGCGTSFHAAQTGGEAVQALELVLRPQREANLLVALSHEGETPLTLEAVEAWPGERWLVTGAPESPLVTLSHKVVRATPEIESSWCHTASYTCAVAALAALRGEDVSWLADAVAETPSRASGFRSRSTSAGSSRARAAIGRRRRRRC